MALKHTQPESPDLWNVTLYGCCLGDEVKYFEMGNFLESLDRPNVETTFLISTQKGKQYND